MSSTKLYELLAIFKEAIYEILEEAQSDRDWNVVITACQAALDELENDNE